MKNLRPKIVVACLLLIAPIQALAQAWQVDPDRTALRVTTQLYNAPFAGTFADVDADIHTDI